MWCIPALLVESVSVAFHSGKAKHVHFPSHFYKAYSTVNSELKCYI